MNRNSIGTLLLLALVCFFVGCDSSNYSVVSGKVTYEDKPVSGIRVMFTPAASSGNEVPYSWAVTDESGAFSLETRDGKAGAAIGLHKVGFDWSDIRSYTLQDLKQSLSDAKGNPEREAKVEAEIADVNQKLATRPTLKAGLQTEFNVPEGGDENVVFELTDF